MRSTIHHFLETLLVPFVAAIINLYRLSDLYYLYHLYHRDHGISCTRCYFFSVLKFIPVTLRTLDKL